MRRLSPALVFCLLLAGCGPKQAFAPVEGTVTLDGEPLPGVVVRFLPDNDKGTKGPTSEGYTDEQGKYVLKCASPARDGAVVGWHHVVVEDPNDERPFQGEVRKTKQRVPPKYSDPSRPALSLEVKAGAPTINVPLTRK